VVSIYMLLDFPRLARWTDRRFPPRPGSPSLLIRMEQSLTSYVRGQALVSLIIGTSAGIGLWLLGVLGWLPHGQKYALLFGAWTAVTELIPYLGPWLGAIPPLLYALVVHPLSALWVTALFLAIHQVEGHIVVPNVMGSALRLHPLLVIFGLLAGGEIYGLPGALVALPLLAILAGALEPSAGTVDRADGVRVGWVPQRPAYYDRLTARENLELFARLEGEPDPQAAAERLLARFDLPADRPTSTLSVGNRQ